MFQPATPVSVAAFLGICAVVLGAFFAAVWSSARNEGASPARRTGTVAVALAAWLGILMSLVGSGWLAADVRRIPVFGVATMLVILAAGFSSVGRWLASAPIAALVLFQGFRLPLELVLHAWVRQGVIPATMTWTGANWDIVSGTLAIFLAPFAHRGRMAGWIFNAIGVALLLNVMQVAILSSPLPFAWPVQPKLELVLHLPYALIVPVCVGGALLGHLALTRALVAKTRALSRAEG